MRPQNAKKDRHVFWCRRVRVSRCGVCAGPSCVYTVKPYSISYLSGICAQYSTPPPCLFALSFTSLHDNQSVCLCDINKRDPCERDRDSDPRDAREGKFQAPHNCAQSQCERAQRASPRPRAGARPHRLGTAAVARPAEALWLGRDARSSAEC